MKLMNLVRIVLVAAFILAVAACAPAPAPTTVATEAPAVAEQPFGAADCAPNCTYADMVMCYPQLGAESDWRTANTASFKDTSAQLGYKLVFSDAQQKQENQISAIRACIQQGVSVIALPPVVEDGWDAVLTEAQNAGIPVIIVDRSVSAAKSMYASHIGSDMALEGERAAEEFNKQFPDGASILELSGTTGSGAAEGRAKGFREKLNSNITIIKFPDGQLHPRGSSPCDASLPEEIQSRRGFPGHLHPQ